MSAQNALGAKDMGSGTGALLVIRTVGGASGSTLAGAIIASGMIAAKHGAGGTHSAVHSAHAHLGSDFAMVYATAAGFALLTFIVSLLMPKSSLRETTYFAPIAD
jgi:hypothetical protein